MKRELRLLSEYLDDCVEQGELREEVYLNACKKVKNIFDAGELPKQLIIQDVVIDYAIANPLSLVNAPVEVNVFDEDFIEHLLDVFTDVTTDQSDRRCWIRKLVEVYFDADEPSSSCLDLISEIASTIIESVPECTDIIMDHINDELCIEPTDLFSFELVNELVQRAPALAEYYVIDGECIDESTKWASAKQKEQLRNTIKRVEQRSRK
tara:strand:- start:484 stop:1110 length:627 start_codon:yes stop_codon:yes gene_type:complete